MECKFVVGQKLVVVSKIKPKLHPDAVVPKVGDVVTVRELFECPYSNKIGVRLVEYLLPNHPEIGEEYLFKLEFFRPVNHRKTDISIFTDMLIKQH